MSVPIVDLQPATPAVQAIHSVERECVYRRVFASMQCTFKQWEKYGRMIGMQSFSFESPDSVKRPLAFAR